MSASAKETKFIVRDCGVVALVVLFLFALAPQTSSAASAPSITTQPQSQSLLAGSNAIFSVVASGQTPLVYQWSINGTNLTNSGHIVGATNSTLTVSNLVAGDAGNYQVVVSNSHGTATSSNATLTVLFPAAITVQPTNQATLLSSNVTLAVQASGTAPLIYQWQKGSVNLPNGGNLSGATTSSSDCFQCSNGRRWQLSPCREQCVSGMTTSTDATLLVVPVVAWGSSDYSKPNVPLALTNTVAIASGLNFNLSLGTDGTVTEWGYSVAPAGLSNVVAIAAGDGAPSMALKRDGTVVAWDDNGLVETNIPAGLSNVVAIASGGVNLALRSDGTVVAWGNSFFTARRIAGWIEQRGGHRCRILL